MHETLSIRPPRLLVSVRDADEAALALAAGADLVDAKDPANGALGALPAATVRAILARLGADAATSAVAGEPDSDETLCASVAAMAATGVGYVKIALPSHASAAALSRAGESALSRAGESAPDRLIGVLFAEDCAGDESLAPAIATRLSSAGWRGLMIDTRGKAGRRLPDLLPPRALSSFVEACRARGLLSGLAGSLALTDIPALAALGPGYLGFRGGLCIGADRRGALDPDRIAEAARLLRASARRDAA